MDLIPKGREAWMDILGSTLPLPQTRGGRSLLATNSPLLGRGEGRQLQTFLKNPAQVENVFLKGRGGLKDEGMGETGQHNCGDPTKAKICSSQLKFEFFSTARVIFLSSCQSRGTRKQQHKHKVKVNRRGKKELKEGEEWD